jgi:hypothetical protein
MKPHAFDELGGKPLDPEGMMFVGDKGRIIAGFRCEESKTSSRIKDECILTKQSAT